MLPLTNSTFYSCRYLRAHMCAHMRAPVISVGHELYIIVVVFEKCKSLVGILLCLTRKTVCHAQLRLTLVVRFCRHWEFDLNNPKICRTSNVSIKFHVNTNLETLVKNIRSSTSCEFEAPEFLPLKTHEDIMKYDSASDEERQKMMNYLNFYDMKSNVKDNLRDIVSQNRLFTDNLLSSVIWIGKKGQVTEKLPIMRRRISHDLSKVLKRMYLDMTHGEFKHAFAKAVNAANARLREKEKNKKKTTNGSGSRKSVDEEEMFASDWIEGKTIEDKENKDNRNPS
ncbi:hypothetical protein KQX54_001330 [Cotesia glomerata]|uniref:DUF4806 domain-containing protein n=1 Tax=Cotesia glomerata TaxID=32391 RepID=A0AAV7I7D3_COTGL|nr:hypothetical protein KQX54_001330 [Cotesia glomerata]